MQVPFLLSPPFHLTEGTEAKGYTANTKKGVRVYYTYSLLLPPSTPNHPEHAWAMFIPEAC